MNRLNNKGQALVIFIVFLPLFIMLGTLIVDISNSKYEKRRLDEVNKMAIKYALSHTDSDINTNITDIIEKNIINIKDYDVHIDDENNKITLIIKKEIPGFFGKIIGKDIYKIESNYTGYIENDKVIIKEGDES